MTIEQLRKAHSAAPFQPFTLRTADGREFDVPHPEFLFLPPQGRTIFIADEDGAADIIDLLLVASIHFKSGKKNEKNGKRKR